MKSISKRRFQNAVSLLPKQKILVVGDLILDEYLKGTVDRISPEAPVPVVLVQSQSITLGGAGNVVKNASSLGVRSVVLGRCGKDSAGVELKKLLLLESVSATDLYLLESESIPTILKTRIMASHQQVCRVDREKIIPLTPTEEDSILQNLEPIFNSVSAVILSDYDKGYLTSRMIHEIIQFARKKNLPITADPQVSHFFQYQGIDTITPNHHEAGKALGRKLDTQESVNQAIFEIKEKLQSKSMMITQGDKGMTVYLPSHKSIVQIPTVGKEVFDVTGAGDTVITTYTAFLACGLNELESAIVSNVAAGIVVGKLGSATTTPDEIASNLEALGLFCE